MLTSAVLALSVLVAEVSPSAPPAPAEVTSTGIDVASLIAPILSTGVVGIILVMILFRIKIMPSYVYDEMVMAKDREIARLEVDKAELKEGLKDTQAVYTEQVIPTLTRVLDAERELVDLRREEAIERRRRPDGS